jgi:ABC-type glycerol-3-phosphate transport system permease component
MDEFRIATQDGTAKARLFRSTVARYGNPAAVALGNFLAADDSPWELLMATGLIYALPPAAIYYVFRRYMAAGLTAGAVKS